MDVYGNFKGNYNCFVISCFIVTRFYCILKISNIGIESSRKRNCEVIQAITRRWFRACELMSHA